MRSRFVSDNLVLAIHRPKAIWSIDGMVCESEYELLEQIGRGSYGKVYRAQHDSGEVHAIKVDRILHVFFPKLRRER